MLKYTYKFLNLGGYGAPTPPSPSGYGAPTVRPSYSGGISTPRPSYGGANLVVPQGPLRAPQQSLSSTFLGAQQAQTLPVNNNNYNSGNNFVSSQV